MDSLNGLGVLNTDNASANIQSPSLQGLATSGSHLNSLAASILNSNDNYSLMTGILNWANQFPEIYSVITQGEIVPGYPCLDFNLSEQIYKVVPIYSSNDIGMFLNTVGTNSISQMVVLCRGALTQEQLHTLADNQIDYVSVEEVQLIDQAATTLLGFVPTNKRFCSTLAATLSKVVRKDNGSRVLNNTKNEFVGIGSDIKRSFTEGFGQLAGSITTAAAALGISKMNKNSQTALGCSDTIGIPQLQSQPQPQPSDATTMPVSAEEPKDYSIENSANHNVITADLSKHSD